MNNYFTTIERSGIDKAEASELIKMLNDLLGREAYVMGNDPIFGLGVESTERGLVHFKEAALFMKNGMSMEDAARESLKTACHQYFTSLARAEISEADAKKLIGIINDLLGRMAYVMDTDIVLGLGVLSTERGVVHFKEAAKLMKSGMPMEDAAKESMKVEPVNIPCNTVPTTTYQSSFGFGGGSNVRTRLKNSEYADVLRGSGVSDGWLYVIHDVDVMYVAEAIVTLGYESDYYLAPDEIRTTNLALYRVKTDGDERDEKFQTLFKKFTELKG
jgi:hypothetical protein